MVETPLTDTVGVVVIGRNEGQRLVDCLNSLGALAARTVYVDSGSTDDSLAAARRLGAQTVELDTSIAFTAARARNSGFKALMLKYPDAEFVQFVDGDCQLHPDWIGTAAAFLATHEAVALVCGRRRERYPDRSIYNALCDREWDGPVGEITECGGDFLVRTQTFREVGGFRDGLIAGEEPELCVRLRAMGHKIWRLGAEMTLHDANITRLSQWWKRTVRSGHAFAEVSALHANSAHGIWTRSTIRAVVWGGFAPLVIILALLFDLRLLLLLAVYPLNVARIALRRKPTDGEAWRDAVLSMLGKFAELQGVLQYYGNRLLGRRQRLIEYK